MHPPPVLGDPLLLLQQAADRDQGGDPPLKRIAILLVAMTATGAALLTAWPEDNAAATSRAGVERPDAAAASEEVTPPSRLRVRLSGVKLFRRATAAGRLVPAPETTNIDITLLRNREVVAERSAAVGAGGSFSARFSIARPGTYRVRATVVAGGVAVEAKSRPRPAVLPSLAVGSSGRDVRRLEERLAELDYYLTGVDGVFDERTSDAVLAFHKVQGLERVGTVGPATWRALADPHVPQPRGSGSHLEVDQTFQVLYVVEGGDIAHIVHASTGAGGATRDGRFQIYKKGGYGREYFPAYFDGRRAFHAWSDVPNYAASAGCVRLPFWAAEWLYDNEMAIGTELLIYH